MTRFQRLHLTIGLAALAVVACMAAVRAQTLDEAVRANMSLALSLCLSTVPDQTTMNAAFSAAGFSLSPEDFGDGNVAHWFHAPANTVTVLVVGRGQEGFCAVSTQHMGIPAAVTFAGEALDALYPGVFTYGDMEGGTPVLPGTPGAANRACTGFVGWNGQRPIVVSLGNAGQDPVCIEDGTVQIMVQM